MGITIHWKGQLRAPNAVDGVVDAVRQFATERGWPFHEIAPDVREVLRIVDDELVTSREPTCGITVRPHSKSEAVTFEFDRKGAVQASCKTQFAGLNTHIAVIALLRHVESFFNDFDVYDEGGYWATGDRKTLAERLDAIDGAISSLAERLPDARANVAFPRRRPGQRPKDVRH